MLLLSAATETFVGRVDIRTIVRRGTTIINNLLLLHSATNYCHTVIHIHIKRV